MRQSYLKPKVLTLVSLVMLLTLLYLAWTPHLLTQATLVAQQSSDDEEPLVFTPALTSVEDIMATRAPAAALAAYLSETSGISVTTFVPTDYGATMQGLARGRYDIAYLPGPFLVKAQAELGAIPAFAVSVSGSVTETGLIVTAADSGIEELADLAGKSVGAANLESGTGWVMPAAALEQVGVNALIDLDIYLTGTDPENVVAVLNGELDAAFISATALTDAAVLEADPDAADKLSILAEFPDVPIGGIVFANDLDPADQEALAEAFSAPELAEATNTEGNLILAALGWDGLVPAEEVDFTALADAATAIGMIRAATPTPRAASAQTVPAAAAITATEDVTATEEVTSSAEVTATDSITATGSTAAGEEPLVFTPALTGVENIMQTRAPAAALATYLTEASGVAVETFVPTDYGATLQGLRRGQYDIAYLPGPFLVKAQAELGVTPAFAVSVNGTVTETGLIIVAADSGIEDLADLAGKSVGAADLESGTGWVMPAAALQDAGVNALIDLDVYLTGTDPENVLAVINGDLDAAFVKEAALQDPIVLEADAEAAEKLTILAEFPDVPIGGIVFGAHVDEADQAALTEAFGAPELAEATDAEGHPLLAGLGWDALVPVDEVDFVALTDAATAIGMIRTSQ